MDIGQRFLALRRWVTVGLRHIKRERQHIAIGIAIGAVPLFLAREHFLGPGLPYGLDGLSNPLPWWHARQSFVSGQLPFYTELWYGGQYQFVNPLWKGFYPFAWPLFLPGLPMASTLKLVLAAHYLAVPALSYWVGRRHINSVAAALLGLLFSMPMALFQGHYEKVFSWPWLVLAALAIAVCYADQITRRRGLFVGLATGMSLLAGGIYYASYAAILGVSFMLVFRDREFTSGVVAGGLAGLPHVLFSIIPVLMRGADRPAVTATADWSQLLLGLGGWVPIVGVLPHNNELYAVVGWPTLLIGSGGVLIAIQRGQQQRAWGIGGLIAAVVGSLLATGTGLYAIPGVDMLRVASRAIIMPALVALMGAFVLVFESRDLERRQLRSVIVAALAMSVIVSGGTWMAVDDSGPVTTETGQEIAATIEANGCDSVWIETWSNGRTTPAFRETGYELAKSGIPAVAVYYGAIGQEYSVYKDGRLTFDVLVTGEEVPESGNLTLEGQSATEPRGSVPAARFQRIGTFQTDGGEVYLYGVISNGEVCTPSR